MATADLAAKITIGFDGDRATRGLANLKGQLNDLAKSAEGGAKSAGGAIGALSGGFGALSGVLSAIAPEIGIPLQILNAGLNVGLGLVHTVAGAVENVLGGAFRFAGQIIQHVIDLVGEGLSRAFELAEGAAHRFIDILKIGLLAGAALIEEVTRRSITASISEETALARLTTALHGNEDAAKSLHEWLQKVFEPQAPFPIDTIVDATTKLELFGLTAQTWLPLVGNMAAALHRPITDAAQAVAMSMMGNERMLREYGITARDLIAHGAPAAAGGRGVSVNAPGGEEKMASSLASVLQEKFGGGMERAMKTQEGLWSNFLTVLHKVWTAIGDQLLPVIKSFTAGITDLGNVLVGSGVFAKIGEALAGIVGEITSRVKELLTPANIEAFASGVVRALNWLADAGRWAWGIITQLFSAFSAGGPVSQIVTSVLSIGNAIYTGLIQPLAGGAVGVGKGLFAGLAAGFQLIARIVTTGNMQLLSAWILYLKDAITVGMSIAVVYIRWFRDEFTFALNWIQQMLPGIIATATKWFVDLGHTMLDLASIGVTIGAAIVIGLAPVASVMMIIVSAISLVVSAITGLLTVAAATVGALGANFIPGFKGITAGLDAASTAAIKTSGAAFMGAGAMAAAPLAATIGAGVLQEKIGGANEWLDKTVAPAGMHASEAAAQWVPAQGMRAPTVPWTNPMLGMGEGGAIRQTIGAAPTGMPQLGPDAPATRSDVALTNRHLQDINDSLRRLGVGPMQQYGGAR